MNINFAVLLGVLSMLLSATLVIMSIVGVIR